jgi:uncharacterized protein (TIGR02145 family)
MNSPAMKKIIACSLILSIILFAFYACEKEAKVVLPTVSTASVDNIYNTSARIGGLVSDDGGADISDRGVYWGTTASPESSGTKLQIGTGTGVFQDSLTELTSGVKYYVKAYATNSQGTAYGDETFFTTQISLPTITTSAITELTATSARVGGVISDSGGFAVSQRGVYWGTDPNPQLTGTKLEMGSGAGTFSQTLSGLSRAVLYYVTAYATNIKGTAYGDEISFTTEPDLPIVATSTVIEIQAYTARVGGNVSSDGGSAVTERGIFWGASADPLTTGTKLILGSGPGVFADTLENLDPGATYYVKAYATNALGTSYGEELDWTTLGEEPTATTLGYSDLTSGTVTLYGLISPGDLSTTVEFEYGTTTAYGSSMIAINSPVTEEDDSVSAAISGLDPETEYHFRVKAVNDLGTVYGEDSMFTTVITGMTGTVLDNDGNTYGTIGIGYQVWMTENLKTRKYNDGSAIPLITSDSAWSVISTDAYCWYENDSASYHNTYGVLYNWPAVNTGKLCPTGWHVPTNDDFSELVEYLGGAGLAGGLLKETGTSHWNSPNTDASDEYDFTALGGGKRFENGIFDFDKVEGNWWSSTNYSNITANYFYLVFNFGNSFQAFTNKQQGMSVRCVKDD